MEKCCHIEHNSQGQGHISDYAIALHQQAQPIC